MFNSLKSGQKVLLLYYNIENLFLKYKNKD